MELLESENQRLKDLLGAEGHKLKKLEEDNGRLRKYNGELRHALIKEQGHDQAIQIPDADADDGGDSQLFSNESEEEVGQTLQSVDAVVFNPIIMDLVLKNLNGKNIKNCRLVCNNWNGMVGRILLRQNNGYGLAVRLEIDKCKGMTYDFQRHTIRGLHSIVASAPHHWFSKAFLDKTFIRRIEIQSVLVNFGYRLRSIEITGQNILFQHLRIILVDWCPNLEQLALPPYLTVHDVENYPGYKHLEEGYPTLVFTRPLKLTSVFMQRQLCISVVKASPNLTTLSLHCDADECSLRFFKELLNCPEVTRNLENVKLNTGYKRNKAIKLLNSIQFSDKLKTLAIETTDGLPTSDLSETLDKLGGPLEKLVLSFENCSIRMDPEVVFPKMNNLTELRYFPSDTITIKSIKFLAGMPNLKALYLGQRQRIFGAVEREYCIDILFSDCEQLIRNPRKKVKELYLFGNVQSPSHTFEMMNKIFPNLTKLVVGIFVMRQHNNLAEVENYYTAVLDGGLSEMRNLKDLYLDFRRPKPDDEEGFDYMSVIFNHINKLSNLNRLTIRDNSKSTTALVGDKLLEIPNLRQVTLIGLKFERLAAKELTMLLYKHDIQLDIEDKELVEDFRVHFEELLTFRRRSLRRF